MFGVYIISGNMGTNLIPELKHVRHWSCLSPTLTALELSSSRMWYPTFLSLRRWFPCFFFKCWVMFSQTEKRPWIFFLVMLLIMLCKKVLTFNCSEWTCKIIVTSHHLSRLFDSQSLMNLALDKKGLWKCLTIEKTNTCALVSLHSGYPLSISVSGHVYRLKSK